MNDEIANENRDEIKIKEKKQELNDQDLEKSLEWGGLVVLKQES